MKRRIASAQPGAAYGVGVLVVAGFVLTMAISGVGGDYFTGSTPNVSDCKGKRRQVTAVSYI